MLQEHDENCGITQLGRGGRACNRMIRWYKMMRANDEILPRSLQSLVVIRFKLVKFIKSDS